MRMVLSMKDGELWSCEYATLRFRKEKKNKPRDIDMCMYPSSTPKKNYIEANSHKIKINLDLFRDVAQYNIWEKGKRKTTARL